MNHGEQRALDMAEPMTPGEPDLLVRYRAGDSAAFDLLVEGMGPRLKGYFLRQGAQTSTAEDLVQNVFVRVLQSLPRYQPRGQLDAFLLRIARNLWIDHRRRGGREHHDAAPAERPDPRPGPLGQADAGDRASQLRSALQRLDPATRELLELAVLQQLPYKEVGMILEIPVGTVKSRVYYSLRKLRDVVAVLAPEDEV